MTIDAAPDRRSQRRIRISRPCKVYDRATGKYYPATTSDLSSRDLLVTVHRPVNLRPGAEIRVGVAMLDRPGLMLAKEMMDAVVVRALETEDGQTMIAMRLETDEQLEATPTRRAA